VGGALRRSRDRQTQLADRCQGLLLATIILAAGMVWLSSRTRYVVYAVEVDKLDYALTQAQPLTASSSPDLIDRIERYEVVSFLTVSRIGNKQVLTPRPHFRCTLPVRALMPCPGSPFAPQPNSPKIAASATSLFAHVAIESR
jgi:hypothetical protein